MGFSAVQANDKPNVYKVTAYCPCKRCCGYTKGGKYYWSNGITASGKKGRYGVIACNHLKFGTKVKIEGLGIFTVEDRGARSYFGSFKNINKHIDIYMPNHNQALRFGIRYLKVEVVKGGLK